MRELSKLELDALTEIINIGVGRAAGSLNDILKNHITLKVPKIEVNTVASLQLRIENIGTAGRSSVIQQFHGNFMGTAALLFPAEDAARLVSVITEEEIGPDDFDSVHSGTFVEVGNIVLNGLLGSLSNAFEFELSFSLPYYSEINKPQEFIATVHSGDQEQVVIIAETDFLVKKLEISGVVFVVFTIRSLDCLIGGLQKYLAGVGIGDVKL